MKRIIIVAGFLLVVGALLLQVGRPAPGDPPTGSPPPASSASGALTAEEEASVRWTHILDVASGEAYQGPWRMNASDFRYVDAPTVALDPDGGAAVAWVDQARRDVLFQRFDAGGEAVLADPVNVSRTPEVFSWLPRVAFDRNDPGVVYVLWQEIVFSGGSHGGEIFFARSGDGGRSFGSPANLSNTPAGAGKGRLDPQSWHNGSLALAQGPEGALYAAWTEYEGPLRLSRSADQGGSWTEPVLLAGEDRPARGPSLAVGPDGTLWLAWTVGDDPAADIQLARSTDGGRTLFRTWSLAGPGHADAPSLAVDEGGTVHLAYAEAPRGPRSAYEVRYTRLPSGAAGLNRPSTLAPPGSRAEWGGGFPTLALDGEANPWILWDLFHDPGQRPLGLALAGSDDGGADFPPGTLVPGTADRELGFNGSLQGLLMRKLAVSPDGRVAVVHGTFNPGERSLIRLYQGELSSPRPEPTERESG